MVLGRPRRRRKMILKEIQQKRIEWRALDSSSLEQGEAADLAKR